MMKIKMRSRINLGLITGDVVIDRVYEDDTCIVYKKYIKLTFEDKEILIGYMRIPKEINTIVIKDEQEGE